MPPSDPDALVIGAGPAGLAAAYALLKNGACSIVVVDRDEAPGGLPQYCGHPGFGWGYTHRLETGPAFTRRLLGAIQHPAVRLLARTTATAIRPGPSVDLVGPECGVITLRPRTVIVATGIRERPRAARLVPGRRPERGVLTTGQLQQMVARGVPLPGRRMVVVGTEHVAFSILLTARHAGHRVIAMVDPAERASTYPALAALARHVARIPIHLASRVVNILGGRQVEGVEIQGPAGLHRIGCDSLVFSGDFIPDAVLAQASGIAIDPRTHGPMIDQHGRTTMAGVFAAGNVLRAVESSGFSAIEGARVGAGAAAHLRAPREWPDRSCPIEAAPEFAYVVPQRWTPGAGGPAAIPFSLRVQSNGAPIAIAVRVGDEVVWRDAPRSRRPHRRIQIPQTAITDRIAEAPSIEVSVTP
jgi:thioredoxin reductase